MEISILEMNLERTLKTDGLLIPMVKDSILMRMEIGQVNGYPPSSFTLDEVNNKNMEYTHVIWYNK